MKSIQNNSKNSKIEYYILIKNFFLTISTLLIIFLNSSVQAQNQNNPAPSGIPFQGYIRDLAGMPAKNKEIVVIATILETSPSGTVALKEQFKPTTNADGVFTIILGQGILLGGTATDLSKIDWTKGLFFLNIQTAVPTSVTMPLNWDYTPFLKDMGTSQFWSVPYAFSSGASPAGGIAGAKPLSGDKFLNVKDGDSALLRAASLSLNTDSLNNYIGNGILKDTAANLRSLIATKLNSSDTLAMLNPYLRKLDTASLSNRINTKLNSSDTLAMLNPYLRKLDSASLSNRINTKLNSSDTLAMLNPYLKKIDTASLSNRINTKLNSSDTLTMLNPYLRKLNTASLSNRINTKLNSSDTFAMLNPYLRKLDTVSLSNRINTKLNSSDTLAMLNPYLRKLDTASLSNRINTKLNISDTLAMLNPYLRKLDTASLSNRINTKLNSSDTLAMLNPYLRKLDTASLSNRINTKLNSSDTLAMLNPYLRKLDTASLSNRINTKLNSSDTLAMLNPYLRKLDTASLSNRINTKLNISDTLAMLNPYLRKIDTASLSNRINTKLNSSDTLTMLNPFLRKLDTASLSNRINIKLNSSDTLAMLNPYLRKLDTASLSNRINTKLNSSDTLAMLNPYLRKLDTASLSSRIDLRLKFTDTAAMLSPYLKMVPISKIIATGTAGNTTYLRGDGSWQTISSNSSQLEKITEGINTGWRILGGDPNNYGDIGDKAIDLSYSNAPSTTKGATGQYAIALGMNSTASGNYTTAMGTATTASGNYATAMGAYTTSLGLVSTTIGDHTTAKSYAEVAIGSYNTNYTPIDINGFNAADRAFVVGIGRNSIDTKDAMIVWKNGDVGIGTSTQPTDAKLEVNGSLKITDGTQGANKVLTSDANGKASWQTPPVGPQEPAGPQGIVGIYNVSGYIYGISNGYSGFIGPTQTISITTGQKICGCLSASLSTGLNENTGAEAYLNVGLRWRDVNTSVSQYFSSAYSTIYVDRKRIPYTASSCVSHLTTGTYEIGYYVEFFGSTVSNLNITNNDWLTGWFMVSN